MSVPVLLVPGLACSARLYAEQIPALWRRGPVMVANHTRDDSMAAIAARVLAEAPPRFCLAGLSMGGYVCFEIMRQAPERVDRLALLDTAAYSETPQQTENRKRQIALAQAGRFIEVVDQLYPALVHPSRRDDPALKAVNRAMAEDVGAEAFVRQQTAIMGRPDSHATLGTIRCPTLVLVGDKDAITPLDKAQDIAAGVAGAKLVVVPECGHLSTLERPEAVNQALAGWLDA